MAIVLPNGILGNPGEQMEAVRWWMMHQMELLASIDLPGEAFSSTQSFQFRQVVCSFSTSASRMELLLARSGGPKQSAVFMVDCTRHRARAAEENPDTEDSQTAQEDLAVVETIERWENARVGISERTRRRETRVLADDLPWIAQQYRRFVSGKSF